MWGKYCQTVSPPGIRLILAQRTEQLLFVGADSHSQSFIGMHYWNHYWQTSEKKNLKKKHPPPPNKKTKKTKKQMLKMETCLARCYRALCNGDNVAVWLHNLIYTNIKRRSVVFLSPQEFIFPFRLILSIFITVIGKSTARAKALPVRTVAFSR